MKVTVRDVMSSNVVTVGPGTVFKDLVRLIEEHHVGALPVVQGGQLVGIVSEADLVLKEELLPDEDLAHLRTGTSFFSSKRHREERARAQATRVDEVMSRRVETIGPDESLAEAARRMHTKRVGQLPVVDDLGALVGIVARSDLLKVYLRSDEDIRDEVRTLLESPAPDGVDVRVEDGQVLLTGTLENRSDVVRFLSRVREVPGVISVSSELQHRTDDVAPEEAWRALPQM